MYIHKSIDVSSWDEATRSKVRQYWEERGFKLKTNDAVTFSGMRGDWLSTLVSLNLSHVRTSLRIRYEHSWLDCSIEMDTRLRMITASERRLLEFELEAFESYLLTGDLKEEAWARHHKECRRANLDMIVDAFANPFRPRKSRKPRLIGDALVFQAWALMSVGVLCLFCVVLLLYFMAKYHVASNQLPGDLASVPIAFGLMGASLVAFAARVHYLWRSSKKCVSLRQAAVRYGMDTEAMRKALEQRGVKAKFIIDGESVYDLDSVSSTTLLRPVRDQADDTLLMPVNEVIKRGDDLLVRPTTDGVNSIAANSVPASEATITTNRQ